MHIELLQVKYVILISVYLFSILETKSKGHVTFYSNLSIIMTRCTYFFKHFYFVFIYVLRVFVCVIYL